MVWATFQRVSEAASAGRSPLGSGGRGPLCTGLLHSRLQIGCYVPAAAAELAPVDRVFTRIGKPPQLLSGSLVPIIHAFLYCTAASCRSIVPVGRGVTEAPWAQDGSHLAPPAMCHRRPGPHLPRREHVCGGDAGDLLAAAPLHLGLPGGESRGFGVICCSRFVARECVCSTALAEMLETSSLLHHSTSASLALRVGLDAVRDTVRLHLFCVAGKPRVAPARLLACVMLAYTSICHAFRRCWMSWGGALPRTTATPLPMAWRCTWHRPSAAGETVW